MSSLSIDGVLAQNQAIKSENLTAAKDATLLNKARDQAETVVGSILDGVNQTAAAIEGRGERVNVVA